MVLNLCCSNAKNNTFHFDGQAWYLSTLFLDIRFFLGIYIIGICRALYCLVFSYGYGFVTLLFILGVIYLMYVEHWVCLVSVVVKIGLILSMSSYLKFARVHACCVLVNICCKYLYLGSTDKGVTLGKFAQLS